MKMSGSEDEASWVTRGICRNRERLGGLGFELRVFRRRERRGSDYRFVTAFYIRVSHPVHGEVLPAATEGELEAFAMGLLLSSW
jgi:hypothetical protein